MIVLDTDHLSLLCGRQQPTGHRLRRSLERPTITEIVTTIVTYEEQSRGWLASCAKHQARGQLVENYRHLSKHLEDFRSIHVARISTWPPHRIFPELKTISPPGRRRWTCRIASIVLSRGATLLSRNLGDFRKVPDLKVEDWSA